MIFSRSIYLTSCSDRKGRSIVTPVCLAWRLQPSPFRPPVPASGDLELVVFRLSRTLRLTPQECVSEHFELARVRFARSTAKSVDWQSDANVYEAAIFQHFLPGCTRQTTGNSCGPQVDVGDG